MFYNKNNCAFEDIHKDNIVYLAYIYIYIYIRSKMYISVLYYIYYNGGEIISSWNNWKEPLNINEFDFAIDSLSSKCPKV